VIIDAFPLGYGADVLLIRLRELADMVDRHVIVEADLWHTGARREPLWPQLVDRPEFAPFADKVAWYWHVTPDAVRTPWQREEWLRDVVLDDARDQVVRLRRESLRHDFVLFGDHDEIPHPAALRRVLADGVDFARLWTRYHEWYLNLAKADPDPALWEHRQPVLFRTCALPASITGQYVRAQQWRPVRWTGDREYGHAGRDDLRGWHLTLQGGLHEVHDKLQHGAHTELQSLGVCELGRRMDASLDLLDRCPLGKVPDGDMPQTVIKDLAYWAEKGMLL